MEGEATIRSRRRGRLVTGALVFLATAPLPAAAGIHYQATTTTATESGKERSRIEVEGWISGGEAKIEFKEQKGSMFKGGNYLLTSDGGRTLYLVDPKDETYARWDLDAMLAAVGNVMESMGPLINLEISEPKVERLLEEAGPSIHGLPTHHYRYRTSYSMKIKVLGMGRESAVVAEQDIWSTESLPDTGLGVWLRADDRRTGNQQFDKLISAEMTKVKGFPLKSVTRTTTTSKKGKSQVAISTTEVTALDRDVSIPEPTFVLPEGYVERPFLPGMQEPEK